MIQATPAIGADGTVYIAGYDKLLYAVDEKTGQEKWRHMCGDSISSSPAIGPDGTIFVGCNDGDLYAIDSFDGSEKWKFFTGDTIHSSPALAADGTVYFGSYDQNIYAVDARTGHEKWRFTTGGLVLSSPLIGQDGTVFIGSMDGKLYAIEGSAPLAKSDWPEFRNGTRRTGSAETQTQANGSGPDLVRISATANNINLTMQTKVGHLYTIESKPFLDLGKWTQVRTFTGTGWNETVSDASPIGDQLFYRLRVD
jgi:outer membrane protein assembly factor BamB